MYTQMYMCMHINTYIYALDIVRYTRSYVLICIYIYIYSYI